MCPDRFHLSMGNRQRGFLLPVALFIIVVMGFAALALTRTTSQTNVSAVQELVSTQALYAAESGVQTGLSELFYPDASDRDDVDGRCDNLNLVLDFSGVQGLNICSVEVQCDRVEDGVYQLSSRGSCGSGDISARRDLQVLSKY